MDIQASEHSLRNNVDEDADHESHHGHDGECSHDEGGNKKKKNKRKKLAKMHHHDGHDHGHSGEDKCCGGETYVPKPIDETGEGTTVSFAVTGVTCADCSLRVEKKLLSQPGVFEVCISSVTQRADVRFDDAIVKDVEVKKLIEDMGFGARIISRLAAAHLAVRVVEKEHGDDAASDMEEAVPSVQEVADKIRGLPGVAFVDAKQKKNRKRQAASYVVSIDYDPDQVGARDLIGLIEENGYSTELIHEKDAAKKATGNKKEVRRWGILFAISAILGVPVLFIAFVFAQIPVVNDAFDTELTSGLSVGVFLEWLLTTPIQFGVGYGLYVSTFRSLWYTRKANVDTLVVISTTTAYVYSVITTILAMSLSGYDSTYHPTIKTQKKKKAIYGNPGVGGEG